MTVKEQSAQRKSITNQINKRIKEKNKIVSSKVGSIRQRNVLRHEARRKINLSFGSASIFIFIVFSFAIFKTMLNDSYQFSIISFLNSLSSIPMINISSILSASLNFPAWLSFLENYVLIIATLGAMLVNAIMVVVWFLRFLFI